MWSLFQCVANLVFSSAGKHKYQSNIQQISFKFTLIMELDRIKDAGQLLDVECTGGSEARATYYIRRNGELIADREGHAFIGKNGLGKTCEGDGKTPEGIFGVRQAFGILPDPGTSLPYHCITSESTACDEECDFYNMIVESRAYKGERMMEMDPEYRYGLETDFNDANVYPLGSAIFIHCKGRKTWTGGCVALDEEFMKYILETATDGLKILIHASEA